jgi:thiamine-phosphate pyrophosphorylase
VHLRGDSLPAHRARRAVPAGFVIGRSVHSAQEAREVAAAGGVDYLLLGTVFPSRSKPDAAPLGEAELARAVAAVSVPVLAIGGIDLERCAAVARTGAAGIAAIGLFGQDDSADPVTRLRDIVARVQEAFDTQRAVP